MMRYLFLLLTLLSPTWLRAFPVQQDDKVYIEPTQVGFSENKIFVKFDEEWVEIDAIRSDKEGLYIKPPYFDCGWKCTRCGTGNEAWRFICRKHGCMGIRPQKPPRPVFPPKPIPPLKPKPLAPEKELQSDDEVDLLDD